MTASSSVARVVFWEPSISPHKTAFIDKVAKMRPHVEIVYAAPTTVTADRKELGWSVESTYSFKTVLAPTGEEIEKMLAYESAKSLHVFSGIRHVPMIVQALSDVLNRALRFGVMSEPRVDEGFSGALRIAHSLLTERKIRKQCAFVLAIGRHGPPWFRRVGYNPESIFPFAYFIEPGARPPATKLIEAKDHKTLAYVGRMVPMKGVGIFLDAAAKLTRPVDLTLVGSGEYLDHYREQAKKLSLNADFQGVRPMNEIPDIIRDCSCLVLPSLSKDDGWGVVVSEALLAGIPVVVSDRVGASIVTNVSNNGVIATAGSVTGLAQSLENLLWGRTESPESVHRRITWAIENLSASAGANYFWGIVDHCFSSSSRPKELFN